MKSFLQQKKLHILCLVEADLHSPISRYKRQSPLSSTEIDQQLGIPGYRLILQQPWYKHGQARILLTVKEELQVQVKNPGTQNSDLQTLTCEIGLARENNS